MKRFRKVAVAALVVALLWWLNPNRRPAGEARDPAVVEIGYMGPGGAVSGAMDDAVRAFEEESRRAHAADPSRPIYRVVSGQNASRGQTEDPTRFLVSVAGGMMMAGSLLMTAPVIVIFFFAQKYFIQGVTLTGMKA